MYHCNKTELTNTSSNTAPAEPKLIFGGAAVFKPAGKK